MKRCPACNTTYGDEQNFCLNDGTTLVSEATGSYDYGTPTANLPHGRNAAPTEVMYATPTAPPMQPAPMYAPPVQQKRSPLPWILVGAVLLIGAAVAVFFLTRNSGGDGGSTASGTTTTGNTSTGNRGTNTSATPTPTASGINYSSPDGRFGITLPPGFSQFVSQKQTQPTPVGPIDLNILQSENPNGACVVSYLDMPEAANQGRSPQKLLEDGRDGAMRNINATLEKENNITVQGRPGISVYASASSQGRSFYLRYYFIMDKQRAYQIGYLAYNRSELDKPAVQAYLDSFNMK
ncbi:MAG TPA: hypothetical protein VF791_15560 [Pyrinomonadaceae bacterium]